MDHKTEKRIEIFSKLGRRLEKFGHEKDSLTIIERATDQNPWFSKTDIINSVSAIREQMLDEGKLRSWLSLYSIPARPKNIGLITAGNIPLVGFFDMLCILICGHGCLLKASSKDSVMTGYMIGLLNNIWPDMPVMQFDSGSCDALIATGSDNTKRYFENIYSNIPTIIRGSRFSAAVLSGRETTDELSALARDIFSYNGLGCRNVSHLLLPGDYNVKRLVSHLQQYREVNAKYMNNYLQRRVLLEMDSSDYIDGGFFILRRAESHSEFISEITYSTYSSVPQILSWINLNKNDLQCVVSTVDLIVGRIDFGMSQSPSLTDYPDNINVMKFLTEL